MKTVPTVYLTATGRSGVGKTKLLKVVSTLLQQHGYSVRFTKDAAEAQKESNDIPGVLPAVVFHEGIGLPVSLPATEDAWDDCIEEVEKKVGVASGGWDMVKPRDLITAVFDTLVPVNTWETEVATPSEPTGNKHVGSSLDSFLESEGIKDEVYTKAQEMVAERRDQEKADAWAKMGIERNNTHTAPRPAPEYKFPHIQQFRKLVERIEERARFRGKDEKDEPVYAPLEECTLPTLTFKGYPKMDGTNGGVVFHAGEHGARYVIQSRDSVLTEALDNYGFCAHLHSNQSSVADLYLWMCKQIGHTPHRLEVYGEWVGQGISPGSHALGKIPPTWIIVGAQADSNWVPLETFKWDYNANYPNDLPWNPAARILFLHWLAWPGEVSIDFSNLYGLSGMIAVTAAIEEAQRAEDSCEVGRTLGVEGLGEGDVWQCVTPGYESSDYWFKVKGRRHQETKTRTRVEVAPELVASANEFAAMVVTPERMQKQVHKMTARDVALNIRSMGVFIKLVYEDVMSEEGDRAKKSGIDEKLIGKAVNQVAKKWFNDLLFGVTQ
jgi:ribosomal protein L37AE/L43A/energy-coupling factor transporter ATP-binding protein EcfA2